MMTKEEYKNTNWKMTYEQYQKCYCPECDKANCPHREAFRRVSKIESKIKGEMIMVDWYGTLWNGNGDRPTTFKN